MGKTQEECDFLYWKMIFQRKIWKTSHNYLLKPNWKKSIGKGKSGKCALKKKCQTGWLKRPFLSLTSLLSSLLGSIFALFCTIAVNISSASPYALSTNYRAQTYYSQYINISKFIGFSIEIELRSLSWSMNQAWCLHDVQKKSETAWTRVRDCLHKEKCLENWDSDWKSCHWFNPCRILTGCSVWSAYKTTNLQEVVVISNWLLD